MASCYDGVRLRGASYRGNVVFILPADYGPTALRATTSR